jgi:hypothetical protein
MHIRAVTPSPPAPYDASRLMERIRTVFAGLPDARDKSNNRRYEIEDAALAAFAVFFTQSPSFLDSQIRMQKLQGKNNATSLFGVHDIPCDNQIRKTLDPVPPETLFPLMAEIGDNLYRHGLLDAFRSPDDTFLIALDGTDFFSSQKISCPCCSQSTLANGKTLYRHIAVTPVLVAPGQESVIALAPQFVQPQDGHDKQDCELAATGRWLEQWGAHYAAWGITFLADDLYCHQPFCQRVLEQNANFIFTCKPDSHPALYEWVADLTRNGCVASLTSGRRIGRKHFTDTYRYVNQVPLRDSDDALLVNWFELVSTAENGKILFHNTWVTNHRLARDNVAALASAGRARWKIENENNNTLKTKGYHFEHNFGHGKQHLANLFAAMILLAFLLHTTLGLVDGPYQTVRNLLPSRRTFFEHLRALIQYLPFDDWDHLLRFMLKALDVEPPNTG